MFTCNYVFAQYGGGLHSFNSTTVRTPSAPFTPPIWMQQQQQMYYEMQRQSNSYSASFKGDTYYFNSRSDRDEFIEWRDLYYTLDEILSAIEDIKYYYNRSIEEYNNLASTIQRSNSYNSSNLQSSLNSLKYKISDIESKSSDLSSSYYYLTSAVSNASRIDSYYNNDSDNIGYLNNSISDFKSFGRYLGYARSDLESKRNRCIQEMIDLVE